jgi:formylmethanofuran dehydrogenase subunit E
VPRWSVLAAAAEFHGHVGPWLALGLRAGLLARRRLLDDPFRLRAVVRCPARRPFTCFIDGVQFGSGCTMGKGNIRHIASRRVGVTFSAPGRGRLTLSVRPAAVPELEPQRPDSGAVARSGRALFRRRLGDLFVVSLCRPR